MTVNGVQSYSCCAWMYGVDTVKILCEEADPICKRSHMQTTALNVMQQEIGSTKYRAEQLTWSTDPSKFWPVQWPVMTYQYETGSS